METIFVNVSPRKFQHNKNNKEAADVLLTLTVWYETMELHGTQVLKHGKSKGKTMWPHECCFRSVCSSYGSVIKYGQFLIHSCSLPLSTMLLPSLNLNHPPCLMLYSIIVQICWFCEVSLKAYHCFNILLMIHQKGQKGATVLILTSAMFKLADNDKPNLSNAWFDSKLLINLDRPQVEKFKNG